MSDDKKSKDQGLNNGRRDFIRLSAGVMGASALLGLVPQQIRNSAWAAGSDAPEVKEVKIGFIPLTDCAPVVVASQMGFDKKYGIRITPSKEASWAGVRDKVVIYMRRVEKCQTHQSPRTCALRVRVHHVV